ncbi:carboxymuconolactone decarboxylase family protein [Ktedonosporobacter rubrisoli]|uniref:Carboxymuconolactone decarboxylase family protein n=1 Tax=Ktedonosporobacter rubrisoli TaxID=2509675 RepID=A0A4P6JLD4_KTERU|nr:carboxymuconolactone decarboxylase family protein [Ktedonosporobacter rubrisoli]QBD75830.1 carboxymuconolactone decarboxylase family protein [Ktedonosporobacter rubrisoli]
MEARMDYAKAAPGAMKAMNGLEKYLANCGLDAALLDLVRLRASQINGCAYCVDMHSLDLRAGGESEQRIYALPVWRETPFFSERERAALLWTEKLTLISIDHVPSEVFEEVRRHFSEEELANLTLAIATINAWNRFGISFRDVPGQYTPSKR